MKSLSLKTERLTSLKRGNMAMTPKQELIQAIEQSSDELVRALLELLRVMQRQQSSDVSLSHSEEVATLQQVTSSSSSNYPLRGLPLEIAEDFDEPMPELWEALSQ
ncbi:MAG: hypothetical protein VKK04_06870 [Synechococcales bacterium]|nr:hypothetical protein [Synechococcales bacterium]